MVHLVVYTHRVLQGKITHQFLEKKVEVCEVF
jgi:hypothetical protein